MQRERLKRKVNVLMGTAVLMDIDIERNNVKSFMENKEIARQMLDELDELWGRKKGDPEQ